MYTKKLIIEKLMENKYFIDEEGLETCLKSWKIDAIYEDENSEEYFDDLAIKKIIKGLSLKFKGESKESIELELKEEKMLPENLPQKVETEVLENKFAEGAELKKITLDITNQTISFLANSIAQKITTDITDHFKETDFLKSAMETGSLQRDNEILAKQVARLIEDNNILKEQQKVLKNDNVKFKLVFGNVYIKTD